MSQRDLPARLQRRLRRAGAVVDERQLGALASYLDLLGRWNERINLTSLKVEQPNDLALDKLIVEPVIAASHVSASARVGLDVGSGGGSPAFPFRIAAPQLRQFVLVESKVRKSAFLREVARELQLPGVIVENRRFEELLSRPDLNESVDVVTIRAVRLDRRMMALLLAFLAPAGVAFQFGSATQARNADMAAPLRLTQTFPLLPGQASLLNVFTRA